MTTAETFVCVSATDVKSWLVMFGFQLSNIIPGFPRAKMYFVPPPYELSESQASESGQVSRAPASTTAMAVAPSAGGAAWGPGAWGQRRETLVWV